jgi:hypothetical protein
MMLIFLAICCIAATVDLTASPPSCASTAALLAMPSVTLAFSVFCAIEAVICSTEALVCSVPAACSLAACDSDCAVALTSSEAEASASAPLFTSSTTCDSFRSCPSSPPAGCWCRPA